MITSKKEDGTMKEEKNVISFCKKININYNNLVRGKQVHGKRVVVVDKGQGFIEGADGLVTTSREVALGVVTADCLPIAFYSENLCGILHAGWRGLVAGVVEEGVATAEMMGESVKNLKFVTGPGIGVCHYEVKDDVVAEFNKITDTFPFLKREKGKMFLDIKKIAEKKIINLGGMVINTSSVCTYCNEEYFSSRRDNEDGNRMISIIRL